MKRHTTRCIILLALATLLTTSGCATWSDETDWESPVWSDDGKQAAAIKHDYEKRPVFGGSKSETRNHTVQVYAASLSSNVAQTNLQPLGPVADGHTLGLYHMASQGYVLHGRSVAHSTAKNSMNETQTHIWERIDLAGKVQISCAIAVIVYTVAKLSGAWVRQLV